MRAKAGDESRDQMQCRESQASKEMEVRGQNKQGPSQAGEGSCTPVLRLLEAKEKESVQRKFQELDLI